ncbi:MAG: xylulokinase [Planctomycetota bacterium]|nr:xylulokinase [Planctomycetota bacterium]
MTIALGLDVGTQGTKGLALDVESRKIVARASRAYGLIEGLPAGSAEQHPDTWWRAIVEVVRALVRDLGPRAGEIRCLGVSGQQHGFVPLDAAGAVIRPAKLWCDTSTADEARELSQRVGRAIPAGFTASKILWLKRHEPANFARLRTVLLPHDWVNWKLTGRACMEAGDASGTGFFDVRARKFDARAMDAIDARLAACVPELVAPDAPIGTVRDDVASSLSLPRGVLVAPGGGDNMMSAIGAGATRPGVFVISLGTSATAFTYSATPIVDPEGLIASFCDSTGGWLPLLCTMNATGVLEEVRSHAAPPNDHASLTARAALVEPGCGGVLFVPYLSGERVPDLPHATGMIVGLRHGSLDPAVLYRAAIEGVSLNLAWGIERMRALGIAVDSVRLVGGGARNPLWRQVLADVLDAPVTALAETETGALGAAMQAASTAGSATVGDLQPVAVGEATSGARPDAERVRAYRIALDAFRRAARSADAR